MVFGLAPSPFLLNGVIQQHLENLLSTYPDAVNEIRKSLYVDDLLSGGPTIEKAKKLKGEATEIFADAKFKLHKWHSNRKELETACEDYEPSFAKEQLENTPGRGPWKLLGFGWDKVKETLHVCFPATLAKQTKCGTLPEVVSVRRSIPLSKKKSMRFSSMYLVMLAVVSQGLVTAKSHLAKQGLTIPQLELMSGHMAVNLITNVHQALEGLTLATSDHC